MKLDFTYKLAPTLTNNLCRILVDNYIATTIHID